MKTRFIRLLSLSALLGLSTFTAVQADEEADLIAVLQSNASPVQKAEACKRLRVVGTARAVPALAPLLIEDRTSQAARYALEGIGGSETDAVLRQALGAASGPLKAGLADSLGWRHDTAAVGLLVPLLTDAEGAVAASAATALGRIGGSEALAALQAVRDRVATAVRPAVTEALLRCADEQFAAGNRAGARPVYQSLVAPDEPVSVRMAAFTGLMRAADDGGFGAMVAALEGNDSAAQAAALAFAASVQHPEATRTFAALLKKPGPALQIALLGVLQARGDAAALPAVVAAARSAELTVRVAALSALGTLGDGSVVLLLAEAATSTDGTTQGAARQALLSLRGKDVAAAFVAHLPAAAPAVQLELVRALTARSELAAVPGLLELAGRDSGAGRRAALQALGSLADGSQVQPLVDLLGAAKTEAAREEVRRVFEAMVQRAGDVGRLDVEPIVRGIGSGSLETRQALLQVGVLFADDKLRAAVRGAMQDSDEGIRAAAARALCDARDAALLPDLLAVARDAKEPGLRSLALEGSVRLATEEGGGLSSGQRTEALTRAFGLAGRAQEKRMVLAGLAQVPNRATLGLAQQGCGDAEVRAEAEQACLQIAGKLGGAEFETVEAVLTRLSTDAATAATQERARALLKMFNSGWLYAGPYREANQEAQALFDVAFPPEQASAVGVVWRRAPGSTDLSRQGEVDFSGIVGGNHCVVYAKTRLLAPQAQPVVFSLGSDDGIKLWVNGELVHANNAVRGLTPDQDKAKGRLREGWNDLVVKITQHTAGCGFTFRVLSESGAPVSGLRLEPYGGGQR